MLRECKMLEMHELFGSSWNDISFTVVLNDIIDHIDSVRIDSLDKRMQISFKLKYIISQYKKSKLSENVLYFVMN